MHLLDACVFHNGLLLLNYSSLELYVEEMYLICQLRGLDDNYSPFLLRSIHCFFSAQCVEGTSSFWLPVRVGQEKPPLMRMVQEKRGQVPGFHHRTPPSHSHGACFLSSPPVLWLWVWFCWTVFLLCQLSRGSSNSFPYHGSLRPGNGNVFGCCMSLNAWGHFCGFFFPGHTFSKSCFCLSVLFLLSFLKNSFLLN